MSIKKKKELESDINKNKDKYVFYVPPDKKSSVWKNFELIKNDNGDVQEFVRCISCKVLLTYNSKSGTGSLLRHTCSKNKTTFNNLKQSSLNCYTVKRIPDNIKSNVHKKQLHFIVKDLRPLSVTEGNGFKELAQCLVNVGAEFGKINVEEVLASRTALTRSILPNIYETAKENLKPNLVNHHMAFTTDMWSDDYAQRSYMTLSCHYINNDFQLIVNILGNREFPYAQKSGVNILKFTLDILKEFDIEHKLITGAMVTDNGSNVVAAFKSYRRLSCACHNLNLVMNDLFEDSDIEPIKSLVEACKKLVGYFKHSQLNNKLGKTLKQLVKTRWNSIFIMFESIIEMKTEIQSILLEKNEIQRISSIDFNLLSCLLTLLKPFKDCSEQMSADNVPTLQEYVLWYEKLVLTCKVDVLDSQIISKVKCHIKESLLKRCQPSSIHLVAAFLNPLFKELNFIKAEQREQTILTVKTLLHDILRQNDETRNETVLRRSHSNSPMSDYPQFKEFLDKYHVERGTCSATDIVDDEIREYLKKKVKTKCNVLEFWKNADEIPLHKELARQILNIPASSTTSERVFSTSGRILEERRSRLLSNNMDKILFLHKNM